jgi:hypothetical protein
MKKVDYLEIMQGYCGSNNKGFLTDEPIPTKLLEDSIIEVRYDVEAMKWIPNRPSRIKYPTARKLINQYRREYAEK